MATEKSYFSRRGRYFFQEDVIFEKCEPPEAGLPPENLTFQEEDTTFFRKMSFFEKYEPPEAGLPPEDLTF